MKVLVITLCLAVAQGTPYSPIPPPCSPSPCGPNSKCTVVQDNPACTCVANTTGAPPNCRLTCVINSDCLRDAACVNQRCVDPCPGVCGVDAKCQVVNYSPVCSCKEGHTGNPFTQCVPATTPAPPTCTPSPCGPNSQCSLVSNSPVCSCLPKYIGNPPYCHTENGDCVDRNDCTEDSACIRQRCTDPCPGACGDNAKCHVVNHVPRCSCKEGHEGDPFILCTPVPSATTPRPTCTPSPCGPNSECTLISNSPVCSCLPTYVGSPPYCHTEGSVCAVHADCPREAACINTRCADPCLGLCGVNAKCLVINHNPVCACPDANSGDPSIQCSIATTPAPPKPTCTPSLCGPNSQCSLVSNSPVCSCLPKYIGNPPHCHTEGRVCTVHTDCPEDSACINTRCADPCPGACGLNAKCAAVNHNYVCSCDERHYGDPVIMCLPKQ